MFVSKSHMSRLLCIQDSYPIEELFITAPMWAHCDCEEEESCVLCFISRWQHRRDTAWQLLGNTIYVTSHITHHISSYQLQVSSVLITSCPDVMMALDLTGVNPTNIPVSFKNCGKISFSSIKFDRQFTGGQLLKFNMESVNSVKMENLDVRDALQVSDFICWILTCLWGGDKLVSILNRFCWSEQHK